MTRPDIAYAVHTVSQFMSVPCSDHYAVVLRILRYLKGTMFHGLHFMSSSSLTLCGFSMLIGTVILLTVVLPLVTASFLEIRSYLGGARSNL